MDVATNLINSELPLDLVRGHRKYIVKYCLNNFYKCSNTAAYIFTYTWLTDLKNQIMGNIP